MTGTRAQPVDILLVEDNPNDVELTLYALRKLHIANHIRVARDGAEALDFIYGEDDHDGDCVQDIPRLILLDLKLPKVNGLEVLERLKSDPHAKMIPVVVLTSSDDRRDIAACYSLGANSFITKPIDFETLTDFVQQIGCYWLLLNQPPAL